MRMEGPNGSYTVKGKAGSVNGRQSSVAVTGHFEGKVIQTISTIGQEGHTGAEAHRAATILRILQGSKELLDDNPWIQNIWFASDTLVWPPTFTSNKHPKHNGQIERPLNDSQLTAVRAMLSFEDKNRIVLVQGPPGVYICFISFTPHIVHLHMDRNGKNERYLLFCAGGDQIWLSGTLARGAKQCRREEHRREAGCQ